MRRLFLASQLKDPITYPELEKYVGGFSGKTLAYIPTAANAEGMDSWKNSESWNLVQTSEASLKIVELEKYSNSSVAKDLKGIDILWVAGGFCGYLMYWMRRCEMDLIIPDLLESGTIYTGSSAGGMVAGQSLQVAEWYPTDLERGAAFIPSLKLVDFDIYPHYEDSMLDEVTKHHQGGKFYLLKNGEHIVVEDGKLTIFGEERVIDKSIQKS